MSRSPKLLAAKLLLATLVAGVASIAQAQFSFFGGSDEPEPSIAWLASPGEAIASAQKSGKPILAYVTSENCGYCRKMEKETWSEPAIGRLVTKEFVPLKLHATDYPEEVAALRIRAFPTTVLITPQGKAFAGRAGFLEPLDLTELLQPALETKEVASREAPAVN